jgi:plasmid maintenance system antidote protein VapI
MIERAFGVPMETLMRMQSSYDIVQTRQRAKLITVRRYRKPAADPTTGHVFAWSTTALKLMRNW